MADVKLTGLSQAQYSSLRKSYQGFIVEINQGRNARGIECVAYKLDHPPQIAPDELVLDDGQYSPRKIQKPDGIELTGANFEAWFEIDKQYGSACLGTYKDLDLVGISVIDNFLRIYSAHSALQQRGLLLHSAGLVFDNKAYVFQGRSNAGKTTLTRKGQKSGARVLSDDINLLIPHDNGYLACAVPFTGEFGRTLDHAGGKETYPLAGIILLEQGDHLETLPVSPSAAVARILTGCPFVNTDENESDALFAAVAGLVANVPVIRLISRKGDDIGDIMLAVKEQFTELEQESSLYIAGISCGHEQA